VKRRDGQGQLDTVVIGPMEVKSEIVRPAEGATVGVGMTRVFGVAWAGEEAVGGVEVSTDGGRNWAAAELLTPPAKYCWSLWEYLWEVAREGEYTLLVRATSSSGRVQPAEHDPLNGGYVIHHCRQRRVLVVSSRREAAADVESLVYDMNAFAEENYRRPLDVELEFSYGGGI
jgi:hypothetical protein